MCITSPSSPQCCRCLPPPTPTTGPSPSSGNAIIPLTVATFTSPCSLCETLVSPRCSTPPPYLTHAKATGEDTMEPPFRCRSSRRHTCSAHGDDAGRMPAPHRVVESARLPWHQTGPARPSPIRPFGHCASQDTGPMGYSCGPEATLYCSSFINFPISFPI
jgi:hypothetical protein